MWVIYNEYGVLQKVITNAANGRVSATGGAFEIVAHFGSGFDYTKTATITIRRPDESVLVELAMTPTAKTFHAGNGVIDYSPLQDGQQYVAYVFNPENSTILNYNGIYNATVRVYEPNTVSAETIYVMGRFDFYVEDAIENPTTNITPEQYQALNALIGTKISKLDTLAVKHAASTADITGTEHVGEYVNGDIICVEASGVNTFYKLTITNGVRSLTVLASERAVKDKDGNQIDTTYLKLNGSLPMTGDLKISEGKKIKFGSGNYYDGATVGYDGTKTTVHTGAGNLYFDTDGNLYSDVLNEGSYYSASLGKSDKKFSNLWLSGSLKDGTNSIAIADIQHKLIAGENIAINGNVISSTGGSGTTDYELLNNKPSINDITLIGNKSLNDLGIANITAEDFIIQ